MIKRKLKNNKGFTLIEMMVSVAIFSIVMVIALGAILTILDSNRKARTLTEVMNNLNFSLETITRSLKTGVEPDYENGVLHVTAIVLDEEGFNRETTNYQLIEVEEVEGEPKRGYIAQCIGQGANDCSGDTGWIPITSELVDIETFDATVYGYRDCEENDCKQPRTQLLVSGTVSVSEKISSSFTIQTTVSQRKLNLSGSELVI